MARAASAILVVGLLSLFLSLSGITLFSFGTLVFLFTVFTGIGVTSLVVGLIHEKKKN